MQSETNIFSEEELEILRERTEKFKQTILDSGPQDVWKLLLTLHAVVDPAIQEKLLDEQKKTNELFRKLIEEQERLSKAIEDFIDKIFEAEALIDCPSEKIIQYPSPSIFSDHSSTQNQDDRPHDQEPCQ